MAKQDIEVVDRLWKRYDYVRTNGHVDYVLKARKCEDFFAGLQWDPSDMALLRSQRRPALTINKILSTISNVMGEQIFNRSEIAFRPRNESAAQELAETLTKVAMQISDNNQLDWVRSDVFADGVITSRGFFDIRLDFSDNLRGEVRITQLNPKNVLIDPDADSYDPEGWADVCVSKWLSTQEIALLYDEEIAKDLQRFAGEYSPYGNDATDLERDRFGFPKGVNYGFGYDSEGVTRHCRVVDRQYRQLKKTKFFVNIVRGDLREIPEDWDRNRIAVHLASNPELAVIDRMSLKVRWTVVAGHYVLHDDWSPYSRFTVVPFFPYFRRGRTIGLVENLLGPQELLNKVSSQELHVVNTTANSGWKVKRNSLTNMSIAELEQRGAQTGLVMELDDISSAEKIQPNPTPTGLDRITYKAEEHIKTISGVSDYQTGFAREDVAARAVERNQAAGQTNLAKPLDNLRRTDYILGRSVLDLIQRYYTEERVLHIVSDKLTGATEQLVVNEVSPDGRIHNDLTLGEYDIIITTQPERDTFQDTQFDQALGMFEKGIPIPASVLVASSKLKDKAEIVKQMEGDQSSPEAQRKAQLAQRMEEAEAQKVEAEARSKSADAELKMANVRKVDTETGEQGIDPEILKLEQAHALKIRELELSYEFKMRELEAENQLKREQAAEEARLAREKLAADNARADEESAAKRFAMVKSAENAEEPSE